MVVGWDLRTDTPLRIPCTIVIPTGPPAAHSSTGLRVRAILLSNTCNAGVGRFGGRVFELTTPIFCELSATHVHGILYIRRHEDSYLTRIGSRLTYPSCARVLLVFLRTSCSRGINHAHLIAQTADD